MHSEPNQPAIKYFNNLAEKLLRRVHIINLHITEEDLYSKQIKIIINPIIIKNGGANRAHVVFVWIEDRGITDKVLIWRLIYVLFLVYSICRREKSV